MNPAADSSVAAAPPPLLQQQQLLQPHRPSTSCDCHPYSIPTPLLPLPLVGNRQLPPLLSFVCVRNVATLWMPKKVFDVIPNKNVVSWTAIICGYIGSGHFEEGRGLLEMGLRPDSFSLVRVLHACSRLGDLNSGEWIDRYTTECGMHRNLFVATSLVDMYAKCGSMGKTPCIFYGIHEKDIVCWSAMIPGYASNGLPKEALDMFFQMRRENLKPDCYAMMGVLSACAKLGALDFGNWARDLLDANEFLSNPVLGTDLIDMYAKCGRVVQAWKIFKLMKVKDSVVYNAVTLGLAMNGNVKAPFGVFGEMEKNRSSTQREHFLRSTLWMYSCWSGPRWSSIL